MSKKRTSLNELAIPVFGVGSRHRASERIRIEGASQPRAVEFDDDGSEELLSDGLSEPSSNTLIDNVSLNGHIAPYAAQQMGRSAVYSKKERKALAALEDSELLQKFQAGDEAAFYTLFERRQKEIYTHCFRMCGRDAEKANDAFQDTFVKVFTRKALFTDATNGRAWLYRIATNTCLNALRYDKRHPSHAIDDTMRSHDPQMQPDFETEQSSLRNSLEEAMAKLPIELREPFLLREIEEFSYEDAAAQLGITVPACRQRVYRAKQILREELQHLVAGSDA